MSPIFVWRSVASQRARTFGACIYCSSQLETRRVITLQDLQQFDYGSLDADMRSELFDFYCDESSTSLRQAMIVAAKGNLNDLFPVRATCPRCGWWKQGLQNHNCPSRSTGFAVLRDLDINDADVAIGEVQAHLKSKFSDVYALTPRKFEEVVANVYRSMGWEVALTKQTRDGGVDIWCLQHTSGRKCIVECKRYSSGRSVGIAAVDRLLGVKMRTAADEAHLVTSSTFSKPARDAQRQASNRGIALSLVDAHEVLHFLEIYSDRAISLPDVRAIFPPDGPALAMTTPALGIHEVEQARSRRVEDEWHPGALRNAVVQAREERRDLDARRNAGRDGFTIVSGLMVVPRSGCLPLPPYMTGPLGLRPGSRLEASLLSSGSSSGQPPELVLRPRQRVPLNTYGLEARLRSRPGAVSDYLSWFEASVSGSMRGALDFLLVESYETTTRGESAVHTGLKVVFDSELDFSALRAFAQQVGRNHPLDVASSGLRVVRDLADSPSPFTKDATLADGLIDCGQWTDEIRRTHPRVHEQFDLARVVVIASTKQRMLRYVFPRKGVVQLNVRHRDRIGALQAIAAAVNNAGYSVVSSQVRSPGGHAEDATGVREFVAICEPACLGDNPCVLEAGIRAAGLEFGIEVIEIAMGEGPGSRVSAS